MEEAKIYEWHQHPLLLVWNDDEQHLIPHNNPIEQEEEEEESQCCWCCLQPASSAPCFICVDNNCGFSLHKVCANSPSELNLTIHRHHPLSLLQKWTSRYPPYLCYFCDCVWPSDAFVYHCYSCNFNFHLPCLWFASIIIAGNKLNEIAHAPLEHPLISSQTDVTQWSKCFLCFKHLENHPYVSFDFGFYLHEKCAVLPPKMNHVCHRKHPLLLQCKSSNEQELSCKICQESISQYDSLLEDWGGPPTLLYSRFFYGCSVCEFAIHFECVLEPPPPVIPDANHPHPFTLFWRQVPFKCDACGLGGDYVAYTCITCSIIVHRNCISLPRIIKSKWHDHRLFHTYFLPREDHTTLDCLICNDEVNAEHGSYNCSYCDVTFHAKCATKDEDSYFIVSLENEDEGDYWVYPDIPVNSITKVLEWNAAGEAAVIEHTEHAHYLTLSDEISEYDHKWCNGCMLPIAISFYHCSQCDFFLHKACAELLKQKHVWHHGCKFPLLLSSNEEFACVKCDKWSKAFAYICRSCDKRTCIRCVIALTPGARTYPGHKHPLRFYTDYKGRCNACGVDREGVFRVRRIAISV